MAGVQITSGGHAIANKTHRTRDEAHESRVIVARRNDDAVWFDELELIDPGRTS